MKGMEYHAESESGTIAATVEPSRLKLGSLLQPGYIHLGVAKEIVPVLQDFGVDPHPVIREAGLDPSLFDDVTNVISHAALGRLLTLSVARTNCPHFGLLVGQRATILSLGLVGRLMQHCETMGDALRSLVANLSIQNRGAVPALSISDGMALFTFSVYQPETASADQISDGALAVAVNAIRSLCGADWNPGEVLLPRKAPKDVTPYKRHFRAAVRFNQESATLSFPVGDLDLRIPGADPMLRVVLEERVHQLKGRPGTEFSDDIRRLLRMRLTTHRCSAEEIALLLAMHRRTLSRRLRGCGIGYRTIANEIRFEIARQLLADTKMPLGQIAATLGYSEASAFTRAFRRWSGQPPTLWRAEDRLA
ncbi:AraC family transcriptional regulator [Chelatococcus asaccharovorans]|uniref:AraC family transcriptional regulator n=1 Tax=Chelatococcus asaccharovorans TaxID=28210 RepID=UPI00224C7A18|nr:AraC family transcriptional regulator [Chelatococcus asaccharovorans]CAH1670021.1 AraC-like DNA-binding protein [Chelatococcus asaccharovorans]CAH1678548.1 AraC-like DNA-binding protein [Chelatococcus asaccharovorans]